ncbi:hypothetical protein ACQXY3_07580 [Corynebacterium diphtheriae]
MPSTSISALSPLLIVACSKPRTSSLASAADIGDALSVTMFLRGLRQSLLHTLLRD